MPDLSEKHAEGWVEGKGGVAVSEEQVGSKARKQDPRAEDLVELEQTVQVTHPVVGWPRKASVEKGNKGRQRHGKHQEQA